MGWYRVVASVVLLVTLVVYGVVQYHLVNSPLTPKALRWGKRDDTTTIRPFTVPYDVKQVSRLQERLLAASKATAEPSFLMADDWSWGMNRTWMLKATTYWQMDYDWASTVRRLNAIPQKTTDILGLRIHFWHIEAREKSAHVVLLLHGWPGSVWEFNHVVE